MGRLTVIGSGELAPRMVRVHRAALAAYEQPQVVILDSPYGFQENVDEMTDKLVDFFRTSLVVEPSVATLRRPDRGVDAARARSALDAADVVFSGPGSPSYALRVWTESGLAEALRSVTATASVTFASAAACTLGRWAIPVYEIYKVGQDPFWNDGLDAFRLGGLPTVMVPHFDNREGGTHDTSHCYIGENRFNDLRRELPPHVVVGVDEHTAAAFDFATRRVEVTGRGSLHLIGADHRALPEGVHVLDDLEAASAIEEGSRQEEHSDIDQLLSTIVTATGPGEAEQAAVALAAWAVGHANRQQSVQPFVELLLDIRERLRSDGQYAVADSIREGLAQAGVVVRDMGEATEWSLDQSTDRPSS